jgi:hypothetical protein
MGALETGEQERGEGCLMNEEKKEKPEPAEFEVARYPKPEKGSGSSIIRGCGIALAIAFLVFMFVVGACFMAF